MKNSRISSSRKMVCFATMFVSLWKFLAMNINQISGAYSSRVTLKVAMLHDRKRFPFVPLAYATKMKERYENMALLLGKIQYDEFKWKLCGDLQVVALLLGMQLAYIKYCCLLYEWDSRDKKYHCVNKLWPKRTSLTPGEENVVYLPLVLPEKIYLPLCT
jgi:hypothetical protein